MQNRTLKVAILAALTVILVLSFAGVAFADTTWSDLPDTVTAKYGVTDNQIASISEGFPGGLWKPYQSVTRAQFTKMAVEAFKVDKVNPATASYTDVAKGSVYYEYVEGAKAAGMITGATAFNPNNPITREQALAIIVRYVAKVNGYNLATMYTAAEVDGLLAHFGDKASIGSALKTEVAFAYDFGITVGDAYGNIAPQTNLTRIQGAAMLIRAQEKIPPANWTAAKIELVTADKSENLIGVAKRVTFKVTTADGHPAVGVLVDFDTMYADPLYVGNISPQAAMTDSFGEVTVNLISAEPGTERMSAAVSGLAAIYTTAYWLALDEVYITDLALAAENNVGAAHEWGARVIVFGPGPRSTSAFDWYNWISTATFDPTNLKAADGIDGPDDNADYADEKAQLLLGYKPRTMAGINVEWSIINVQNPVPAVVGPPAVAAVPLIASVGNITAVDGVAITAAKTATGHTDANGFSKIKIESTVTGQTKVQAVANYVGNPYPKQLFNHDTFDGDYDHLTDWIDQPVADAIAIKTWIPHIIGGDTAGPITPQYAVNNTGEVETFTLTLKDTYGNVIPGYTVEWWIQGVGFFKTDGTTWVGTGEQNKDVDVTNSAGIATVDLKSLVPGQTIVHVKVMDKYGLPYKEWNVVKQWYSIDNVKLGYVDALRVFHNSATNLVNTTHTWTASVSGAKYVYTMYDLNRNGLRDDQVLIGNRADMKAVAGVYANFDGTIGAAKAAGVDVAVGIPFMRNDTVSPGAWYIRFADMTLAANEFWADMYGSIYATVGTQERVIVDDGIREVWAGLAGKNVYFFNNIGDGGAPTSNIPLTTVINSETLPKYVGDITSPTMVVTDAMGEAKVTIKSTVKGYEYVYAVADYLENPQDGNPLKPYVGSPVVAGDGWHELRWASAAKLWTPAAADPTKTKIFAQGTVEGDRWTNPILTFAGYPGAATVGIPAPAAGTAATGVTVTVATGTATFAGLPSGVGYTLADVGVTVTAPVPQGSGAAATAFLGTTGPTNNSVAMISVNAGGGGTLYTVAPTVVIGPPNIAGGIQATATANISGGNVVSITVTNGGSGYTAAPAVTFTANTAATAVGTIATVNGSNQVATITGAAGLPNGGPWAVTVPAPIKTQATATATLVNGVVTGLTLVNAGAGYITAPVVTITGVGTGALAHATVNANSTLTLVLDAGGSGYAGVNTTPSSNPNRDTIAVQVYDQYGNALEGYKVTFEIVGQGTTTAGSEPTYHPYAHFENPSHNLTPLSAGLGDLNPFVNANLIWDRSATPGQMDDDYAWGYTLNHQINFTKSLASAAHVDLVLDQTSASLDGLAHITNIVNIQVFDPKGVRIMEKEVTKEWSTVPPRLATINLSVGISATGPWVTSLATNISPVYYRVQLLDQYGDPWTSVASVKVRVAGPFNDAGFFNVAAQTSAGITIAPIPALMVYAGLHTLTAFYDTIVVDGQVSPGELTSGAATVTVQ